MHLISSKNIDKMNFKNIKKLLGNSWFNEGTGRV